LPVPWSRALAASEARMAKRSRHAVSGGLEARSERPGDTVRAAPAPTPCQAISSLTTVPSSISFIDRPKGVSIFRSGSIPS
jgi:hypothetical protein